MKAYRYSVKYVVEGWDRWDDTTYETQYKSGTVYADSECDAERLLKQKYTMKDAKITLAEASIVED